MPIYTRTGDTGTTLLYGDVRLDKDDPAVEVCGNIDELSASLGVVRAEGIPEPCETIILRIQQELFAFCTEIIFDVAMILPEHVQRIESEIDRIESELPLLSHFIIAGESQSSAMLHLSRTICRRAERSLATLCRTKQKSPHIAAYLNRLSDLLFVLARKVALQD
jgi:cob(I)alamin adenosyltransferase